MTKSKYKTIIIANTATMIFNLVVLIVFGVIVRMLHGQFTRTFNDMDVAIPRLTAWVMWLPQSWFYTPVIVGLAIFLIVKEKFIKSDLAKLVINKLFLVGLILCVIGYIVAMMMPLYSIPQTL